MDLFEPENLELTLKASNEGIWDWDIGSTEIYYSERVYDFFGLKEGTAVNIMLQPESILHRADVPYFKKALALTLEDKEEEYFAVDSRIICGDGSSRWLRIRGIVVRDEAGTAQRVAGSMIDITKRKFAEIEASEERNRLKLLIDNVPLQVYFKNKECEYVLVNQRQAEWVGANFPKDLIGNTAKDYFCESSWTDSHAEEMKIMETGEPMTDIIQREEWPDRAPTYVKKMKYPWFDTEGTLLGTYGISCDVTHLVTAQKKLESLALDLKKVNDKFEEELILAKEIQLAILPENSSDWSERIGQWKDRLAIHHLYIPATELAGDYYDIINISENKIGFLIVDVMGHGIRSALIVSLIRGLMEQALPFAIDPASYMSELNRSLTAALSTASVTMFASANYVLLDYDLGIAAIASAGHDAPLIQFKEGVEDGEDLESLNRVEKGPALGLFEEAAYSVTEYDLESLEKMMLYTDGIYEIPNESGEDWGVDAMRSYFESNRDKSAGKVQTEIHQKALDWTGGSGFLDDVCLISIDLKPCDSSKEEMR